jgi:hypothetical protein
MRVGSKLLPLIIPPAISEVLKQVQIINQVGD